jgi:hypothetical protein
MTLSAAIHLGSTLGKQLFGRTSTVAGDSCVMGAVYQATGLLSLRSVCAMYPELWAVGCCPLSDCPWHTPDLGSPYITRLCMVMMHLNDLHHWSRQRIADWIDESAALRVPVVADEIFA